MGIQRSNLSNTGFDYVVAVSQASINATLVDYLWSGLNEVVLCYVYDASNNLQPIDYNQFLKQNNITFDPFSIPNGTSSADSRVSTLNSQTVSFAFAVKAKLGIPDDFPDPTKVPPIVALKPGQSNVTYTMTFAEFVAIELVYGPRGSVTWVNLSQQSQPAGTLWTFSGPVDLNLMDADFTNLPAAVQQQIKDIGDPNMFSVQQLYYDLNNAALEQSFTFNNVPSNSALSTFMTGDFISTYWEALHTQTGHGQGPEVLGYGAKQSTSVAPSAFAVTDLNFFTPSAVGTEGAPLTLNYLCALNGSTLDLSGNKGE